MKMTDNELRELRQRNEERARALIKAMGPLYACHPANWVQRQPVRSPGLLRLPAPEVK